MNMNRQQTGWSLRSGLAAVADLEAVEADDTASMRNVALSQDFFCFLQENNQHLEITS